MNPVRALKLPHMTVEANDELHIFTDSEDTIAADFDDEVAPKKTESTGDNQGTPERVPTNAPEEECP